MNAQNVVSHKKYERDFSGEEKSKSLVQKKKGCASKEIQEVHEEWRRKYALIKNGEPSTLFLSVIVGNEFIVARLKLMNWLNNSNWHVYAVHTDRRQFYSLTEGEDLRTREGE